MDNKLSDVVTKSNDKFKDLFVQAQDQPNIEVHASPLVFFCNNSKSLLLHI